VADFTPRRVATGKIKKPVGSARTEDRALATDSHHVTEDGLTLRLVRTPDILAEVAVHAQRPRLVVGFAAETDDVEENARGKLARKRLDMIAANRVGVSGAGFESDDNALAVYWRDGERALGPASKTVLADALLDLIAERLDAAAAGNRHRE